MPIYEYVCSSCNCRFELRRPFSEATEDASCPECDAPARKLFSSFAALSKGDSGGFTSIGSDACSTCSAMSCDSCRIAS